MPETNLDRVESITRRYAEYGSRRGGLMSVWGGVLMLLLVGLGTLGGKVAGVFSGAGIFSREALHFQEGRIPIWLALACWGLAFLFLFGGAWLRDRIYQPFGCVRAVDPPGEGLPDKPFWWLFAGLALGLFGVGIAAWASGPRSPRLFLMAWFTVAFLWFNRRRQSKGEELFFAGSFGVLGVFALTFGWGPWLLLGWVHAAMGCVFLLRGLLQHRDFVKLRRELEVLEDGRRSPMSETNLDRMANLTARYAEYGNRRGGLIGVWGGFLQVVISCLGTGLHLAHGHSEQGAALLGGVSNTPIWFSLLACVSPFLFMLGSAWMRRRLYHGFGRVKAVDPVCEPVPRWLLWGLVCSMGVLLATGFLVACYFGRYGFALRVLGYSILVATFSTQLRKRRLQGDEATFAFMLYGLALFSMLEITGLWVVMSWIYLLGGSCLMVRGLVQHRDFLKLRREIEALGGSEDAHV